MTLTRWTHGHTLASGVAGGLLLDRHILYVFALGLLIGALAVYSSKTIRAFGRAGANAARETQQALLDHRRADTERKLAATEELRSRADHRVRTKAEQEKAVERAYIRGCADGDPRLPLVPRTVESDLLEDR